MTDSAARPYRVAVYYAPAPDSDWWSAGSHWLGRCAATGRVLTQPCPAGLPPHAFAQLTAEPRRYGWHATLKAPFQLAEGQGLQQVRAALHQLCQQRAPFDLPPLQACAMGSFLALRPAQPLAALEQLAADCVRQLHPLAAPLSASELARRRRAGLTAEQDALLLAWGYPWVLDHYRFHLSLTGTLGDQPAEPLLDAASRHFGGLGPCRIDRLSLFAESTPGADFVLVEQMRFEP